MCLFSICLSIWLFLLCRSKSYYLSLLVSIVGKYLPLWKVRSFHPSISVFLFSVCLHDYRNLLLFIWKIKKPFKFVFLVLQWNSAWKTQAPRKSKFFYRICSWPRIDKSVGASWVIESGPTWIPTASVEVCCGPLLINAGFGVRFPKALCPPYNQIIAYLAGWGGLY